MLPWVCVRSRQVLTGCQESLAGRHGPCRIHLLVYPAPPPAPSCSQQEPCWAQSCTTHTEPPWFSRGVCNFSGLKLKDFVQLVSIFIKLIIFTQILKILDLYLHHCPGGFKSSNPQSVQFIHYKELTLTFFLLLVWWFCCVFFFLILANVCL